VLARGALVGLTEALEDVGQKLRRDACACITDDDFNM